MIFANIITEKSFPISMFQCLKIFFVKIFFEVNFKSEEKKQILVDKLKNVISERECAIVH